ncbi:MAG: hypothetical protein ACPGYT_08360, partial [Nitrospirales bacterium]
SISEPLYSGRVDMHSTCPLGGKNLTRLTVKFRSENALKNFNQENRVPFSIVIDWELYEFS